ncbi:hypothetical protein [Paenibacillus glacialis]|uniref:FAD/FMN-containing dehydrogenase n=1 Tax=Paenibacillus glacialis TaxID=494026 RepID=A0A168NZ13_9BACL|nr:hypothetical protein [Paenibacillus glacialis]OAB46233.1 hypothetical protein PGLA_02290 [Paenibacillus glacialis]
MKTKVLAVIGVVVLSIGIGTIAYATEVGTGPVREMRPFMKEMHPNLNESELEQMYNSCHQQGSDNNYSSRMMNNNSRMYDNSMMHH